MEDQVVFDSSVRKFRFIVYSIGEARDCRPECHENWDRCESRKEEEGPFAAADLRFEVVGND